MPGFPPAFNPGKRPTKPPDYSERHNKAISATRKAGEALASLLAEERFDLPSHDVWPPSAPRELTGKFSYALKIARGAFNQIDPCKSSPHSAQNAVQAVVTELERRPDLAERAYERKRNKLQRRPPAGVAIAAVPPAPPAATQQAPAVVAPVAASVQKTPKAEKRLKTNELMILELEKNPEARGWTIRQWKAAIGRSTSSIHDADQWRQLKAAHDLVKVERAMRQDRLRGLDKTGIDLRRKGRNID